ncbi:glycoside hydrolase family 2 protein [Alloiococcus sp. CFN-8]|uniref:glycoside hydrolase family 2 protein n=1 Tax=Alloiococcus sp. CFN-8 TaxID=3416081 RepID=UPI003CEBD300
MRNEYPRPDFRRDLWMSLNGQWDFDIKDGKSRKIQVPFVFQSKMSGIGEAFEVDRVVYKRSFKVPEEWKDKIIILNFGAVDYRCSVYINGSCIGHHEGGQTPFAFEINSYLTGGEEEIIVEVEDPLYDETIARGKQFWEKEPKFIWYTPSSGIWQSVWLEAVEKERLQNIYFTPDVDEGTAEIRYTLSKDTSLPCELTFRISCEDKAIFNGTITAYERDGKLTVDIFNNKALSGPIHFEGLCWSPENPVLFDVEATLSYDGEMKDKVISYFGMRKIHIENGRIFLNNRPYYQKLLLDQGYWKESLITAPSDEAYKEDIIKAKAMGFNGVRKHEKVEDPRYLYWADKLGFLVWEGMASFWSYTPEAAGAFTKEWIDVIKRDYNHPCIVVWGMLNESWGVPNIYDNEMQQSFANSLYYLAHSLDKTRLVIGNDGWEMTKSDICAIHSYKHGATEDIGQQKVFEDSLKSPEGFHNIVVRLPYAKGYEYSGQPIVLTEFGGISLGKNEEGWGYTNSSSGEEFLSTYERIIEAVYSSDSICGYCYTQLADVQQEVNGLLNEDREFKIEPEIIKKINDRKK